MTFSRLIPIALVSLVLAACGTTVSLDDSKVSDAKATPVQTTGDGSDMQGVKPVSVGEDSASGKAPAGVAQVIYFDFDSDVIKPEFQSVVAAHAKHLAGGKGSHVFIEGHTDERGGREYNLALGQRRAEAVRRALSLLGVSDAQVEAVSFGKEKPADSGHTEEAMAKNRRAEFSYR